MKVKYPMLAKTQIGGKTHVRIPLNSLKSKTLCGSNVDEVWSTQLMEDIMEGTIRSNEVTCKNCIQSFNNILGLMQAKRVIKKRLRGG